ncbi:MAG: hypothetical protein JSS30_04585 [Verrucomicrobia bacterium]|nr:hypothetical protein [Verrucomicrobiota bacterium]
MSLGKVAKSCADVAYDYACEKRETVVKPALTTLYTIGIGAKSDIVSALFNLAILAGATTAGVKLAEKAWNLKPQERNVILGTEPSVLLYLAKKTALYTAAAFCFGIGAYELYAMGSELHAGGLDHQRKMDCDKACYNFNDRFWPNILDSQLGLRRFLAATSEKCRDFFNQEGSSCFKLIQVSKVSDTCIQIFKSFGLHESQSA